MPDNPEKEGAKPDPGATPEGDKDKAQAGREAPAATTDDDADFSELGEAGKRALADLRRELKRTTREGQERERELTALKREKQEREDAERTELEKAQARIVELEDEAKTVRREAMARSAATDAGIPDLWDRLRGESDEELAEDAKAMAERFGSRQPATDLGAGARTAAPARGNADMNERIRRQATSR